MDYAVLIVAAGRGSRMNLGYNKVFYKLDDGMTIIDKTMAAFLTDERCKQIVVALNREDMRHPFARECGKIVRVFGGATRQESVYNGLMAIKEDYVLIHDGARPKLDREMIDLLLDVLQDNEACIPAVKAKDTLKRVKEGYVKETIDRSDIYQAQTPQAFRTELILKCHKIARQRNIKATDDSQVVELTSDVKVRVVYGDEKNIKLTTPGDLEKM